MWTDFPVGQKTDRKARPATGSIASFGGRLCGYNARRVTGMLLSNNAGHDPLCLIGNVSIRFQRTLTLPNMTLLRSDNIREVCHRLTCQAVF